MASLRLHVVDRHTEVERLVRTAEFNRHLGPDRKPVLLYSSQVFGSGKTMFGINATLLLKDPAVAQALLDPADATNIPEDLIGMRKDQTFTPTIVEEYVNARTIYVDLGRGLEKSPATAEKRTTFEEALYHAIYCTATEIDITMKEFYSEIGSITPVSLMNLLVKKTGHTGKWFFFIDEIGTMETFELDYDDIKPRSVDAYTRLFAILRPFLQRGDTFVFCAGKSAHLTAKSLEETTSPVLLRLMAMSPLLPQHIVEVLRKTELRGKPLHQVLGLPADDNTLILFANILYHYTGGIPRLVLAALESLLGAAPLSPTRGEIEKVMNEKVRSDIVVDTSTFFRPEHMDADATQVYTTLLLMSVLGINIKKSWVLRMGPAGGTKFVLDWVSNLCLHISPDGPDTYRLVFSQFLIDWLQRFPPDGEPRIVLLASLLDQLRSLPCLIDQGRILEVMIAQSLAIRLSLAETFGDIPGLQGTLLHDVAVPRDLGGGFNIQFMPSFQPCTTSGTPNIEGGVTKSYNPDDWDLFFQDLGKDKWNTVGIVREQNSNGPDLMLPIRLNALANTTQLPASFFHLGIAAKNLQAKSTTNWEDVQEEIEKGLKKPLSNKQLEGKLQMVLVIASTHLMGEIAQVIGTKPCGVYDAGTWFYNKSENKLAKGSLRGYSEKFTVPDGGQLVILSEGGMAMLLGAQTLASLANYYTREEDRCTNLLLMEHSFSALARPRDAPITYTTTDHKRKREDDAGNDHKRKREGDAGSSGTPPSTYPNRTFKVVFVEDGSRKEIAPPGMAVVSPGTLLNDAKNIISSAFLARNPSLQGRKVIGIEWEGVLVMQDEELEGVRHRDTVVAVIAGDVQNNK